MGTPFAYYGGKARLAPHLVSLFPAHNTYCEVFGGGAACLFRKEPSLHEVYNDIDGDLVHLFRTLRDTPDELIRRLTLTPHAAEEHAAARSAMRGGGWDDPIERARQFYVLWGQSYGKKIAATYVRARNYRPGLGREWARKVDGLWDVAERLRRVQFDNLDFRLFIAKHDDPNTFFFCDPTYVWSTRGSRHDYRHEMSDADHHDLLGLLTTAQSRVMVCGYDCELYRSYLSDWHVWTKDVPAMVCRERTRRTETVWMNFEPTPRLA